MKAKTKLIMSIMSVCLVCAVFAIGVFALRTANLKIGGDVSFSATGVEAHIRNASVSGAVTSTTLAANDAEGEVINTSMTQSDIDTTFANWSDIKLDFDENATDIELKFEIANTSTNADHYIEIDYDYSFTTNNPNVDVFPGDENAQGVWENNNYILAPKGATPAAGDYETFTLKFKVLDKELNVKADTKVSVNIKLKHTVPAELNATAEQLPWGSTAYAYNGLYYELKTNTANLSYYKENITEATIPAVVKHNDKNYIVTETGNEVYQAVIPYSLKTLSLPNSMTSIFFSGCRGLTSTTIPNSVTSIGYSAFSGCTGLTTITIPNSVTSIGYSAFSGCTGLTSIIIPNSVTSIDYDAFSGCTGLTSIIIPNSVTSIGDDAFSGCTGLTSIIVSSGNSIYDSRNKCNAIIETATNTLVLGFKNTTIPSSVTSIGDDAFSGCTGLTSIIIPNSVTSIGVYAFLDCTGLTSITIPSSVTSIKSYAFGGCTNLSTAKFENPTGWWYADSSTATSGTSLTISATDFAANATLLTTTYGYKYWFRTVA